MVERMQPGSRSKEVKRPGDPTADLIVFGPFIRLFRLYKNVKPDPFHPNLSYQLRLQRVHIIFDDGQLVSVSFDYKCPERNTGEDPDPLCYRGGY